MKVRELAEAKFQQNLILTIPSFDFGAFAIFLHVGNPSDATDTVMVYANSFGNLG